LTNFFPLSPTHHLEHGREMQQDEEEKEKQNEKKKKSAKKEPEEAEADSDDFIKFESENTVKLINSTSNDEKIIKEIRQAV
jgi:alpha-galactosidase/6-phospho-beta-glucosidase family protein